MQKVIRFLSVFCFLAVFTVAAHAQPRINPVEQLTGKVWMQSSQDNKKAVIFGVDCAIVIEHYVAKESQKKKSGPCTTLSPFEKGWSKAFKDESREELVNAIDKWYKEHPEQMDKPVFEVIWYEMIAPKLQ